MTKSQAEPAAEQGPSAVYEPVSQAKHPQLEAHLLPQGTADATKGKGKAVAKSRTPSAELPAGEKGKSNSMAVDGADTAAEQGLVTVYEPVSQAQSICNVNPPTQACCSIGACRCSQPKGKAAAKSRTPLAELQTGKKDKRSSMAVGGAAHN